jgi:hypothetical protein
MADATTLVESALSGIPHLFMGFSPTGGSGRPPYVAAMRPHVVP